jgi:hypothetical protein
MLPSTAHSIWSAWTPAWIALTGTVLGVLLLASIGTAQALVMPPGTTKPFTWIGWTALGWCAGLTAFSVVAPPLWHAGQPGWQLATIGIAGGSAMAFVMAAVTGIGVLRFTRRAVANGPGADHLARFRTLSSLLGTAVFDTEGDPAGTVRDLVVDLAAGPDRKPVTGLMLARRGEPDRHLAWGLLAEREGLPGLVLTSLGPGGTWTPKPTEVLARRDILDSPVVLAEPPRRARVSDVVLDLEEGRAWVSGVDLRTIGALRRLLGPSPTPQRADQVDLSQVHLVSAPAHAAQLAAPDAMIFGLQPQGMAEVLTRLPVARARDVLGVADRRVVGAALPLLHPHVHARVTGSVPAPRRTRRLAGWALHRPAHSGDRGPRPGPYHRPRLRPGSGPQAQK